MATLYELAFNLRDIVDTLDDCEDDAQITNFCEKMEEATADLTDKAEAYVKVMRNLETDIDAVKAEIDRLKGLKERREKVIERLKENLRQCMGIAGLKRIETPLGTWSTRMSPWSVTIIDEEAVDDRFKVPQPPKVSKNAILDEFKVTGEVFPGVEISKREYVMFR